MRVFSFLFCLFLISPGHAEETPNPSPQPISQENPMPVPAPQTGVVEESMRAGRVYLEDTREVLSKRVVRLSESVDALFGNTRADDARNTSTLRVSQTLYVRDGDLGAEDLSTSLNLYLPNFQKWEKSLRDKYFSRNNTDEGGEGESGQEPAQRYWDLNTEAGLVVTIPVNYFAKLRLRRNFLMGIFENSFYQEFRWSKKDEWEETSSLTTDYAFDRELLFRFINEANWAMTNERFGTHHGPSLIQTFTADSALSYDFRFNTKMEGYSLYGDSLVLSSTYTQRTSIDWIYLKTTPEIAWARKDDFAPVMTLYLKVDLIFGNEGKD
ncbi:hypothetical protein AB1A81_01190 [Bdellovibrio bacteriovorus]|uniref:Uncharacterized protein n=2 Tax=Bdellovibrio bacteriovorus TaxID=959 RepID=Q6MR43_BDEBA|nr:hypothetical protein predicted by Glimmer/Critica [Bdellovibrio bacteriovorus HD100]